MNGDPFVPVGDISIVAPSDEYVEIYVGTSAAYAEKKGTIATETLVTLATSENSEEAFYQARDDLFAGHAKSYKAGYAKALEDFDVETDHDPAVIAERDHVAESHFYHWDSRLLPLESWLAAQFGIEWTSDETEAER